MWVWSLDQKDPLENEMATHSSVFAWKISFSSTLCDLPVFAAYFNIHPVMQLTAETYTWPLTHLDSINTIVLRWDSSLQQQHPGERVFLGDHTALYFLQVDCQLTKDPWYSILCDIMSSKTDMFWMFLSLNNNSLPTSNFDLIIIVEELDYSWDAIHWYLFNTSTSYFVFIFSWVFGKLQWRLAPSLIWFLLL